MKGLKKIILSAGLGQAYFDLWWRYRCRFEPLPVNQQAKGFYFVHIPKTAGTSMLRALGVKALPYTHCPARTIHHMYPDVAASLRFVTVVRDPYARFASSFAYITQRSDWPEQRKFAQEVIGDLSFAEFVRKMADNRGYRNLILGYEFFFPQSYFTHRAGVSLVDDILRFETLSQDFETSVRSRFPSVSALPVLRNHGGGDYGAMYNEASAGFVRDIYAEDFRNFGYPG